MDPIPEPRERRGGDHDLADQRAGAPASQASALTIGVNRSTSASKQTT